MIRQSRTVAYPCPSVSLRVKRSPAFEPENHWHGAVNGRHRTRMNTDGHGWEFIPATARGTPAFLCVLCVLPLRPLRLNFLTPRTLRYAEVRQEFRQRPPFYPVIGNSRPLSICVHPCLSLSNDYAGWQRKIIGMERRAAADGHGWTRMDTDENWSRRTHGNACRWDRPGGLSRCGMNTEYRISE